MFGKFPASIVDELEKVLKTSVIGSKPIGGGDINEAHRVELADGRPIFVKWNEKAPPGMFAAEARGLQFLAEAGAEGLVVPEVLARGPHFLALELLDSTSGGAAMDEALGRGLALLHRSAAPSIGLDQDNFIATLPQKNKPQGGGAVDWANFYGQERIMFQLRLPQATLHVPSKLHHRLEKLVARMSDYVGPQEPPARVHGDLWAGNWMSSSRGPALVDPAAYGGNREVDLAMMKLFGGYSQRVFDAYDEAYPRAPGHEGRVALYQLYPLLVHVNLFGAGYVGQVEAAAAHYV